jgi:hypothetical protein
VIRLRIIDMPCSFCGVEAGEPCQEVCHAGVHGAATKEGEYHSTRISDCLRAERVANLLLGGSDD